MKRWQFILLASVYAFFCRDGARGQSTQPLSTPQPPCVIAYQTTAAGNSKVLDNRSVGCVNFAFTVSVPTTVSALSIVVQTAQDNGSTNCSTCTWSTFTAATGANPITSTTGGNATFATPAGATYYDYLRIQLTSVTGTGSIQAKLIGTLALSASGGPPPAIPGCPSGPVPSVQFAISSTKCAGSANFTYQTSIVGATPIFNGSGPNNMTAGGSYTDGITNPNAYFTVTISATGTPDNFTWSKNGGSASVPIAITGAAQALSNGVTVTFAVTTGHTLHDAWVVQTSAFVDIGLPSPDLSEYSGNSNSEAYASNGSPGYSFQAGEQSWVTAANGFNSGESIDFLASQGTITSPTNSSPGDLIVSLNGWYYNAGAFQFAGNFSSLSLDGSGNPYWSAGVGLPPGATVDTSLTTKTLGFYTSLGAVGFRPLSTTETEVNNRVTPGALIQLDMLAIETTGTNFAGLAAVANSTQQYCSDCQVTSSIDNTCANSGSGAQAVRINGAWKCLQ